MTDKPQTLKPIVICMGSQSDWPTMQAAKTMLDALDVDCDAKIISAHRTPDRLTDFAKSAMTNAVQVIIAGAGGAAHLPGMVASLTPLPVVGVPIKARISIDGWDSILSILQMPPGVPVATVALNGGRNAGILAAQILGATDIELRQRIASYKAQLQSSVEAGVERMAEEGWRALLKT